MTHVKCSDFSKSVQNSEFIKVEEFLSSFVNEYAVTMAKYINYTGSEPFSTSTQNRSCLISKVLSKVSDFHISQDYVFRKQFNNVNLFKVWFRKSIFDLSINSTSSSISTHRIGKKIICAWNDDSRDSSNNITVSNMNADSGYRVSINIIHLYESIDTADGEFTEDVLIATKYKAKLIKELKPTPNWTAIWELERPVPQNGHLRTAYQWVIFVAKIEKVNLVPKDNYIAYPIRKVRNGRIAARAEGKNIYAKNLKVSEIIPNIIY